MKISVTDGYELGQWVYVIHDISQTPHLVTSITSTLGGSTLYNCQAGGQTLHCYEEELSIKKTVHDGKDLCP